MVPEAIVTLTVPAALAADIEAAAAEEHRPAPEVLRDALDGYRRERHWRRLIAYGAERGRATGLAEADVTRLVTEYRGERRRTLPE